MNTSKSLFILAAAVCLAACGGNAGSSSRQAAPVATETVAPVAHEVSTAVCELKSVPQEDIFSSTVLPFATNNIVSQTAGRIRKINVEVGDFVRKGQILAQMDRLNLDQARLKLVNDSTEFVRIRSLYEQGGISASDYEAMELAYNVSKSSYANLLENTILRSPIDGVVTARNYDAGDMYSMAQPIFVVQQITPVKVLVAISESDYTKVKKGDAVKVTSDAIPDAVFSGRVERVHPTVDAATHTVLVEVHIANNYKTLRPGMYVKACVTFGINNSIVIPDTAVIKQQGSGQRSVFVLGPDNKAVLKVVTLGRHFENSYEILSGLEAGETVLVKGHTALNNGDLVKVI